MSNNQKRNGSSMGYYIALGLCAVAIGVCGWLYTRNESEGEPQLNDPDQTVAGTVLEDDIPVGVTKPHTVKPTQTTEPSTEATEPSATVKEPMKTVCPVEGQTVAAYAMDALSYNQTTRDWRVHNGMDIAAEAGTTVRAAADGTVYTVYDDKTMGMTVVIRHDNGYTTEYSSLAQEVLVTPGQTVAMGDPIGTVGSSALLESALGDHVHFSVSLDGEPIDPAKFLDQG